MVGLRDGLQKLGYREDDDFFLGVRFTQGNLAELSCRPPHVSWSSMGRTSSLLRE